MQCGFSISLSGFFFFLQPFCTQIIVKIFSLIHFCWPAAAGYCLVWLQILFFFSMPECTYFLFLIKSGSKSWGACPSEGGFSGLGLVSVRFGWVRIG